MNSKLLQSIIRLEAVKVVLVFIFISVIAGSGYMISIISELERVEAFSTTDVEELITQYTTDENLDIDQIEVSNVDFPNGENRLIIPEIGVNVGILPGEQDVLEQGIWHRFPERGDPINTGNFILAGHRFNIGLTTDELRRKSPLYNIDKLETSDEIIILWDKEIYTYSIEEIKTVVPTQIEVEAESEEPILTLYTCTLEGETDGRVVVHAVPSK